MVSDLGRTCAVACPVVAGVIHSIRVCPAISLRAGEHIVPPFILPGRIIGTFDEFCLFRYGDRLAHRETESGVSVKMSYILSDWSAFDVEPWSLPDSITRIDSRLIAGSLGAEICTPRFAARAHGLSQRLAVPVGAGEAAEIGAVTQPDACHEKTHRILRLTLSQ
jgi:hypothetical protein